MDLRSGHPDLGSGVDEGLAAGVRREEREAEQGARSGPERPAEGAWSGERAGSAAEAKPRGEPAGEAPLRPEGRWEPAERAKPEKRAPAEGVKSEEWASPAKVGLLVGELPLETEVRAREKEGPPEEARQAGREELAEGVRSGTRGEAKGM